MRLSSFRPLVLVVAATLAAALTGCATSATSGSGGTATPLTVSTFGGRVHGGNQPVTGAALTLWAAGAPTSGGGYGTGATSVATTTSDGSGNFTFNTAGVSPCTIGQYLYITAAGGNTGAGINKYSALMAALPSPCSASTGSTYVWINEVTTVAAVSALQQFMTINPGGSPAWTIGAPSTNLTGLANAFTQTGNLASIATGTSQAFTVTNTISTVAYNTTITPDQAKIYTLADILASCVNTAAGATCNSLFSDTTPGSSSAPTDTIQVAYYLAANPAGLTMPAHGNAQGSPYYLCTQYALPTAPFNPTLTCTTTAYPTDWTEDVSWAASTTAGTMGTVNVPSIAIDASGNVWTAPLSNANGVTEFNQAGQVILTPVTSTLITGGYGYAACGTPCTGSYSYATGGHTGDAIAIDTNGNTWVTDWNGATIQNTGNQNPINGSNCTSYTDQGVVFEINNVAGTGTTSGYLTGISAGPLAIDTANNLYFSSDPINGSGASSCELRYYFSEIQATPAPAYTTFDLGTNRQTSIYGWSVIADENPTTQHMYEFAAQGETTIPVLTNAAIPAVIGATTALPATVYWGVTDSANNIWATTNSTTAGATGLMYINIASSTASPTVTTYTQGTAGTAGGGLLSAEEPSIDGAGNLWVVNSPNGTGSSASGGGISEFVPGTNGTTLTPLSPTGTAIYGFDSNAVWGAPVGSAIDSSGNVWIKTRNGSNMYYLVGVAAPVVTPLSVQNLKSKVGLKP